MRTCQNTFDRQDALVAREWIGCASLCAILVACLVNGVARGEDPWVAPAIDPGASLEVERDAFLGSEVAAVFPHISGALRASIPVGNTLVPVSLTTAGLNAAVSPVFQIAGYRFSDGFGELGLSYRFLVTDGRQDVLEQSLGVASTRSRLDINTFDFDYIKRDVFPESNFKIDWYVGARVQFIYFDTAALSALSQETARNFFYGAGPLAGIRVGRTIFGSETSPVLSLFTNVSTGMVIGYNTNQDFSAAFGPGSAFPVTMAQATQQATNVSPFVAVQVGVSAVWPRLPDIRWQAGYQFEEWFQLGLVGASRGDVYAHGIFLGGAWTF
jgi:hypothetical protein